MTHDLIFFPDYRAANPYQSLLYERLARLHPRPGKIGDARAVLDQAVPGQGVIFHLHWEDALHRHLVDSDEAAKAIGNFLSCLEDFVNRGGTFVWTVHNHRSHIAAHPGHDQMLRVSLARLADRIHVHSLAAAAVVRMELDIAFHKLIVLPHGNYRAIHDPNGLDRAALRASRGWRPEQVVVLLFGRLDAYKGGAELLSAFVEAPDNLHLVIAGKQVASLDAELAALPWSVRERIEMQPGFVPEAEVGRLFCAVDAVMLPYRAILTSGTLMMALTLGRPVLAPDLPVIRSVVTGGCEAMLYEPGRPGALANSLQRLASQDADDWNRMTRHAAATGLLYDWDWIARQLGGALIDAASHGRSIRRRRHVNEPLAAPA